MTIVPDDILNELLNARSRGNPYDSKFLVTSIIETNHNHFFTGINWETPYRQLTSSCAETSATIIATSICGASKIKNVWLSGKLIHAEDSSYQCFPCGVCRQVLAECAAPETQIHSISSDHQKVTTNKLSELYPHAFTFDQLYPDCVHDDSSSYINAPRRFRGINEENDPTENEIIEELRHANKRAFAPDKSRREACIIQTENHLYYTGSSYNTANIKSTHGAISSALAMMNSFDGPQKISKIWFMADDNREKPAQAPPSPTLSDLEILSCYGNPIVNIYDKNCTRITQPILLSEMKGAAGLSPKFRKKYGAKKILPASEKFRGL